jgi:hypothetical protein
MGWYRSLPEPKSSGITAQGVKGTYCDNNAKPEIGKGIGGQVMAPNRKRTTRVKWKIQYTQNRLARAALNEEFRGENKRPEEYHTRLAALSKGTA